MKFPAYGPTLLFGLDCAVHEKKLHGRRSSVERPGPSLLILARNRVRKQPIHHVTAMPADLAKATFKARKHTTLCCNRSPQSSIPNDLIMSSKMSEPMVANPSPLDFNRGKDFRNRSCSRESKQRQCCSTKALIFAIKQRGSNLDFRHALTFISA